MTRELRLGRMKTTTTVRCVSLLVLLALNCQVQAAPPAAVTAASTVKASAAAVPPATAAKPLTAAAPGTTTAAVAVKSPAASPAATPAVKAGTVVASPTAPAAKAPAAAKTPAVVPAKQPPAPASTIAAQAAAAKATAAIAAAAAAAPPSADPAPAMTWLQKNGFKKFLELLDVLNVRLDSSNGNIVGTMFVPTDAALDAFSKAMGVESDLNARAFLVDRIVSYHFMPGYTLADFAKQVPASAGGTFALSGDTNYMFKVIRDAAGKVSVMDTQRNFVPIPASQKPVVFGKLSLIPVSTVLLSGGYFTSPEKALAYYPDWATAGKLLASAGAAVDAGKGDLTFFVPGNAALKTAASLPAAQAADLLKNHVVKPSVQFPTWGKAVGWPAVSGKFIGLSTTLVDVVLPWTTQKTPVKLVTLVPDVGPNVNVTVYNIYVGKAIYHGISGLLSQSAAAAPAAAPAKPAGRRLSWSLLTTAAAGARISSSGSRRSLLQAFVTTAKVPTYNVAFGLQAFPNFFSADNTAAALKAASDKSVASWKAGWNPAAAVTGNCFNCGFFAPKY